MFQALTGYHSHPWQVFKQQSLNAMLEQQTSDGEPRLQQHVPLHVDKEVPMNQNLSYLTY